MGTVATKLGGTIQASTQRKLATVLTTALAGRTWTGKECLLRSLSDLAVSAPEILATTLAGAKEGDIDRQTLVAALMKECKKEKLEYRVIALEATGTVLSELKLDHFQVFGLSHYSLVLNFALQELYEIVESHLPKAVPEADKENGGGEMDVDREEGVRQVELQHGILTSLGLAWPETRETQEQFLPTMVRNL